MEATLKAEFAEMSLDEVMEIDGGKVTIFGVSIGGLASGTLAGAAVGGVIGGPVGFVAGAVVCAGVTYLYDSF